MATPQTPLLLIDNIFDTVNLYTAGLLSDSSEVVGQEARHAVDYRRERTFWQAAADGGLVIGGTLECSGAQTAGAGVLSITATTSLAGSVVIGDQFTVSGTTFTATSYAIINANVATFSITPNIPGGGYAANTAVTGYTGPTGNFLMIDMGSGSTANPDFLWLDRGHNLNSVAVKLEYSDNATTWTTLWTQTIPALTTIGSNPSSGFCNTDEGACYYLFAQAGAAHRYWRFRVPYTLSFLAQVTGIICGNRFQSPFFSKVYDEDAGARSQIKDLSTAGWQATARTYSWRTCQINLATVDIANYDNTVRALRSTLFEKNQPVVITMDWGNYPNRSYLFQYDDTNWAFNKTQVYRDGLMKFRELYSLVK